MDIGRNDLASPQEQQALIAAMRQVAKDISYYENHCASEMSRKALPDWFDFSQPPPTFRNLSDANECVERLWQECSRLSDQSRLISDRIEKNSTNSSRPPSSDNLQTRIRRRQQQHHRSPSARKQGAQLGHPGHGRCLVPVSSVDETVVCLTPKHCSNCSEPLEQSVVCQRKQVTYLKHKRLTVTEYQRYKARCPQCRQVYRGEWPLELPKGAFGPCVLSIIGTLTGRYRLSKRQVQACLWDLFGLKLSIGTISNAEAELSNALTGAVAEVKEALSESSINHIDETTHYRQHHIHWLWLLANQELAYVGVYAHRTKAIAQSLVESKDSTYWVSDRYGGYAFIPKKQHQYCWAHLKRDLKALMEHEDPAHAAIGAGLEDVRCLIFDEYRAIMSEKGGDIAYRQASIRGYLKQFRVLLRQGVTLTGKKTAGFCQNLLKNWRCLWNFLLNKHLPTTNNHAERLLRHNVLWRKISLGTQSYRGDRYVERISTAQLSCRLQARNLVSFLTQTLICVWAGHDPPSLLVQTV